MAYNVSGWGTAAPNANYWVGYSINGGEDFGAQAKPEGAVIDGTENGSFTSSGHTVLPLVDTQQIWYSFNAFNNSSQYLSFMLCGGGLV